MERIYFNNYSRKDGKYTITNEHTPEKITVKGKKIWDDANNKDGIRPDSITVALLANGKETGKTVTVTKATALSDNEWPSSLQALIVTQMVNQSSTLSKEVGTVNGYTAEEKGMNVTNTHTPEKPTPGKTKMNQENQVQNLNFLTLVKKHLTQQ